MRTAHGLTEKTEAEDLKARVREATSAVGGHARRPSGREAQRERGRGATRGESLDDGHRDSRAEEQSRRETCDNPPPQMPRETRAKKRETSEGR